MTPFDKLNRMIYNSMKRKTIIVNYTSVIVTIPYKMVKIHRVYWLGKKNNTFGSFSVMRSVSENWCVSERHKYANMSLQNTLC